MTIKELLDEVDGTFKNVVPREQKIKFLSRLDGNIYKDILQYHENAPTTFNGYDSSTDENTELLVDEPYDEMYVYYVIAQINMMQQEVNFYNNNIALYEEIYRNFRNWYCRTYKSTGLNFMRV